jgi:Lon-like protease
MVPPDRPARDRPPLAGPVADGPDQPVGPGSARGPGGAPGSDPLDRTGFPGDAAQVDDPGPTDPPRRRLRRRTYVLSGLAVVIVAVLVACAFLPLPYYRFSPGTLYPTQVVISVTGVPSYREDTGLIDFTTVSSKKATALEAGLARFDPAVELIDAALIDGDRPPEETRQINLEAMADSKQKAEVVAARALGFPVTILGTGAVVRSVGAGMPAEKILKKNDTVVEIDGVAVSTADDLVKQLQTHAPGDTITLRVEGPPSADGTKPEPRTETAVLGARKDDATKPILGIDLGTRNPDFKVPFSVQIDSKSVGGPSAGLAFTLGIVDVLTPGSLTGGRPIAVTGTIELDGSVGPIGGIRQKTFLAKRNGMELFVVPTAEAEEARSYAGSMKVVGVDTLDDALKALADNGGSIDSVHEAAAANSGTTVVKPAN